jgi:predicted nucleic acid-binding protein
MRYLLDVNSLIALGIKQHTFRLRLRNWLLSIAVNETPRLATCSITELGFIRVVSQVASYGFTVNDDRQELKKLKDSKVYDFVFIADANDTSMLPAWVKTPKQTTDGHLAHLARSNGAILATFDTKIRGSFLIPS